MSSIKPLTTSKAVAPQEIPQQSIVENGYGDFVLVSTYGMMVSPSEYKKVFKILNDYLPQVHQKPVTDRLKVVNNLIEQQHPECHVKAVFVPRSLYELCFLVQGYEDELAQVKKDEACDSHKICCHTTLYSPNGGEDNLDPKDFAFRLNRFIVYTLNLRENGLTKEECQEAGNRILSRFKEMDRDLSWSLAGKLDQFDEIDSEYNFRYPIMRNIHKGDMIDPANLKKAITLECEKDSENSIILYRGSRFDHEPLKEQGDPYTPCFGLSLFAGYVHDTNACAGARMFYDESTTTSYAIRIPLKDQWQGAFDIPSVSTICGLCSKGELFHARGKCIEPHGLDIQGYCGQATPKIKARLVSPLNKGELRRALDKYLDHRILFRPDPNAKQGDTDEVPSGFTKSVALFLIVFFVLTLLLLTIFLLIIIC